MRAHVVVTVLTLCLVGMVSSTARAQGGSGVIVGANFATVEISPSDGANFDRRTGFLAGIFLGLPLGQSLTLQPELLYSQKGMKFKDSAVDARLELDYLDVPVLARITSAGGGLALVAGPSFGFKIRARAKSDIEGENLDEDVGDQVESFDFGFVLGAGVQSRSMFVDGRYQWGLSNFNKAVLDVTEAKNRVFSILLGFRF